MSMKKDNHEDLEIQENKGSNTQIQGFRKVKIRSWDHEFANY